MCLGYLVDIPVIELTLLFCGKCWIFELEKLLSAWTLGSCCIEMRRQDEKPDS